jgi:hypothetical protein
MSRRSYFLCQTSKTALPSWFANYRKAKRITVLQCHFEQIEKEEEEVKDGDGFDHSGIFKKFRYTGEAPVTPSITEEHLAEIKRRVDFAFFTCGSLDNHMVHVNTPHKTLEEVALCTTESLVDKCSSYFRKDYWQAYEEDVKKVIEHLIQQKTGLKLIYKITGLITHMPECVMGYVVYYLMMNYEVKETYTQADFLDVVHHVQAALTRLLSNPDKKDLMYDIMGMLQLYHTPGGLDFVISKYSYDPETLGSVTEKIDIAYFRQYEFLAQRCFIERISALAQFKMDLVASDDFFNNLVFQKMKEALDNPEGKFPNAASYKFYDAKRVMAWVFENFFDICLGYGRPSMYDTVDANIMNADGSTPNSDNYSILPWTHLVLSGYSNKLLSVTDQDMDFLCQELLNLVLVSDPKKVFGILDPYNQYMDTAAVRFWPNNFCFCMKAILAHEFPGRLIRYYPCVMCNSHPLISNLVFSDLRNFMIQAPTYQHVNDLTLSTLLGMAQLKINDALKLINDDHFMSNLVLQAMRVAKDDGVVSTAGNKEDNVGKQIADIVVSSQTALMTTLTKSISGQGKEITLHSNIISQEGYDNNFVCYVNESGPMKTYPVKLENMDSVEIWFKDGDNNIIDLNNPDKKVKFRVEMILETLD